MSSHTACCLFPLSHATCRNTSTSGLSCTIGWTPHSRVLAHSSQGQTSRNATATSLIQVHPLLELSVKSPHASLLHHHLPRAPLGSHSCQERGKPRERQADILILLPLPAQWGGSLVSSSTSKLYIWGMELKYETIQLEHEQGNESQQLGGRPSLSPSIHRVSLPINSHLGCWWFC